MGKRFENFCDLCEAILAFHKAHGGRLTHYLNFK
ncbi:MAG: type III-A CRISPR-associated protein Csm2 [Lewinellaceae bacterium]|nr:type III-A CRISPR-associated protein Csm2 [Lewinellaceae bacterium]